MKHTIRQYGPVVILLACILALAVGVTALLGGYTVTPTQRQEVLATTYPIYVAAQRILGGDTDVTLTRLDGAASGCLHDYQMSPADRRAVHQADLILMNGAGAESFLHGMVAEEKCVDTSKGIDLLCADHHHDHGEEEHPHETYNEHLWLSPSLYAKQVLAVMNALIALDAAHGETYRSNAENYLRHIDYIDQQMKDLSAALRGTPCVLFHDSMAYLAADLGLDVRLTLSVEGESGLSAHDLGEVEELARQHPNLLLLYDTQYALRYEGVAGTAVTICTAVQEDWLSAMYANLTTLKQVAG